MVARSPQVDVDSSSAPFWTLLIGLKIKREHSGGIIDQYKPGLKSGTTVQCLF